MCVHAIRLKSIYAHVKHTTSARKNQKSVFFVLFLFKRIFVSSVLCSVKRRKCAFSKIVHICILYAVNWRWLVFLPHFSLSLHPSPSNAHITHHHRIILLRSCTLCIHSLAGVIGLQRLDLYTDTSCAHEQTYCSCMALN